MEAFVLDAYSSNGNNVYVLLRNDAATSYVATFWTYEKRRGLFPGKWQTYVPLFGLKTILVALQTKRPDSTWAYIYRLGIIVMLSRKVDCVGWIVHYVHGNKIDGLKLLKEINGCFF